ncbi:MAG: alpha/beta fold hydrolase, partial [Thermoflexales bacterium]|nr:alpha/beta fold hydrolase [Thermoflexales bacterium]
MQVDIELYRRDAQVAPGLRLSVIDIAPEAPARTMVFIHGFGGKASQWRNQLLAFSDTARVIAPDLRGHGQSDAPHSAYTVAEHVADLDAALTLLGVTGRFVLLGHSFGGAIVTEYALAHPERVEKLVLLATAGEFKLTGPAKALLQLPLPVLSAIHRAYAYRAMFARPHAISDMYRNAVSVWQGWSAFRSLQTPTLVIRGNRDNVFEPRYFTDVARTIPGAEEVDVGASGHMVMLERTAAVNRAIERFVAERPRGRSQTPAPETRAAPWLSFYDKDVPPTISIPPVALPDVLRATARRFPHRHAMIFGRGPLTNKISYRALDRDASR